MKSATTAPPAQAGGASFQPPDPRGPDRKLGRFLVVPGILLSIGLLVAYPVFFLVVESFNLGDSGVFPPQEIGIGNYIGMIEDAKVLWNTAFVAGISTIMAVGIGLLLAWILTRTAIPGRQRLERLMELPYYMTPLVGALAWGVLVQSENRIVEPGGPRLRRHRRHPEHLLPLGHRLGDGIVRGHGRFRHDLGRDEIDGPVDGGKCARAGRR